MATIEKHYGGWRAKIRKRGHPPQSRTFPTKALAVRWASEVEADMARGVFKDTRSAEATDYVALLDKFVAEVLPTFKSSGNRRSYETAVTHLRAFFKHDTAAGVGADRLLSFVRHRAAGGVTLSTVKKDLQVVAKIAAVAPVLWSVHVQNPVKEVLERVQLLRLFAPEMKRDRRVTPHEYAGIEGWAPEKPTLIREVALFAVETAMRRGEIAALKWTDVDLVAATAVIRESKTDAATGTAGRTIALTPRAVDVLRGLPKHRNGCVFNMQPDSITQAFDRMCESLGIEGLRFHDLRHEATSRLFEKGLGIQEVASITGHADWGSLKRYTHPRASDVAKKLASL